MTQDQFQKAAGISAVLAVRWFKPITDAMAEFGIDTPTRQANFIAQTGTESAGFSRLVESFNYSVAGLAIFANRLTSQQRQQLGRRSGEAIIPIARQRQIANLVYGGRYGNTQPDDGWTYRGRGLKQITFRANYAACGTALALPLLDQPDLLLQDVNAARSAGWFWQANKLNPIADSGNVEALTRRINGGENGLADRIARTQRASQVLV